MNPVDEKIIIKKLKAGDNEAYKYLYDYHYVALCKLSYYMLKDKIQAESIVSDVIFTYGRLGRIWNLFLLYVIT